MILLNFAFGLYFAWCARDRVRTDGVLASPAFYVMAAFVCMTALPVSLYLGWAHASWFWLYLVDPDQLPVLLVVLVPLLHGTAVALGWYIGAHFLRNQRRDVALYILGGAIVACIVTLIITGPRIASYGSYPQFQAGYALDLFDVKLGYVLIALFLGVLGSATYVAWELTRDSRRIRAR